MDEDPKPVLPLRLDDLPSRILVETVVEPPGALRCIALTVLTPAGYAYLTLFFIQGHTVTWHKDV